MKFILISLLPIKKLLSDAFWTRTTKILKFCSPLQWLVNPEHWGSEVNLGEGTGISNNLCLCCYIYLSINPSSNHCYPRELKFTNTRG